MDLDTLPIYSPNLEDILDRPVLLVSPTLTVLEVIQRMYPQTVSLAAQMPLPQTQRASYVLITTSPESAHPLLLGIFTERDAVRLVAEGANLSHLLIQDVMTTPVHTLLAQDYQDIFTVISELRHHQIRHLPVLNAVGTIMGVITLKSLRQKLAPINLLKWRTVREAMSPRLIQATPDTSVQAVAQLMSQHQVSCVIITAASPGTNTSEGIPIGIVTEQDILECQLQTPHWANRGAGAIMSTPLFTIPGTDPLFNAHQIMERISIRRLVVVGDQGELEGIITERDLLQTLNTVELYGVIEYLQQEVQIQTARVASLEAEKLKLLESYNTTLNQQLDAQTQELRNQAKSAELLATIAHRIRQSLHLHTILETTVAEVRQFLQCDRVFLYRFQPDWSGIVVAESVRKPYLSLLNRTILDPCFVPNYIEPYLQGQIRILEDRDTAPLTPCHQQLLVSLQIRSKLIVPILQQSGDSLNSPSLWGLLIANQCLEPRQWQTLEINLLENLATQIAIALQQSSLFEQAHQELQERQKAEAKIRRLNAQLEQRVKERTAQLEITNHAFQEQIQESTRLKNRLQHSDWQMREIFSAMMDMILIIEADIQTITVVPTYPVLFAHPQWDLVSATIERLVNEPTSTEFCQPIHKTLALRSTVTFEYSLTQGSSQLWFLATLHPFSETAVIWVASEITTQKRAETALQLAREQLLLQVEERTEALERANTILIQEVQDRQQAEAELRSRSSQQAVIAQLGQQALASPDLQTLLDQAVTLVAQALKVDYCSILELLPNQTAFRLVAGSGWRSTLVNQATISAGYKSQAGYTLTVAEPVIMEDLRLEHRFTDSFLLYQARITSGASVTIQGQDQPFGVLSVHTKEHCQFSDSDLSFLQVIANVIATALERWQAEEELNHFFNLSLDMLSLLETDGHFKRINPRFETTLGYQEADILHHSLLDFVHPQDVLATEEALENLSAGLPIFDLENRYRCADGSYRWLAWTATPSATDNIIYSVARDITERKVAEAALRDSEELHRLVLSTISDAVFITDSQGEFTFICPNVSNIFGFNQVEIQELGNIEKLLGRSFWPEISQTIKTEITNLEQEITDKFGKEHLLLLNLKKVQIKEGTLLYCCRDITARKQAEIALAKRERYLSALVAVQHRLLSVNRDEIIDQSLLGLLGEAAEASRVFLFKNHWHSDGSLWGIKELEWCAPGVCPTLTLQKPIPLKLLFPRLTKDWKTAKSLTDSVSNIVEMQQYFERVALHSLITLPLLVQGQFYGFIGISDGVLERKWEPLEIDLLNSGAAAISLALERQEAETALKTFNQELENIIEDRTHELKQTNDQLLIEIIERQQIEIELEEKAQQQEIISEVGQFALSGTDLHNLARQVVMLITQGLRVEYCKVLVLLGETQSFLVLGIQTASELVYLEHPITPHLTWNLPGQFSEPQQYKSELINGITVSIQGQVSNLGYLGIYSYKRKILNSDDLACLQSIASILAIAIERKQSEIALQESESQYRRMLNTTAEGIWIVDPKTNTTFVNQRMAEMLGYQIDEMLGKSFLDFTDEMGKINFLQHLNRCPQGGLQTHDFKFYRKDQSPMWGLISASPIYDANDNYVGILKMITDISDRQQAEDKLKASLKEKELLLKEIHHRVKNNLLVVSNLLEFQADYTQDPATIQILSDCQHRVASMALIHEKLYRSTNLDRINFGEYMEALVDNLFESYNISNDDIKLILDIEPVFLNVETANPCGLIINELLCNILKHAFPDGRCGTIYLSLKADENHQITLIVEDDGIGFPENLDFHHTDSLGMELICTLTEQIKGKITLNRDRGTSFELIFSELKYRQRW